MHWLRPVRRDLPDVFSMSDDGVAVAIDMDVPEDFLETAAEAKDNCPASAIEEA